MRLILVSAEGVEEQVTSFALEDGKITVRGGDLTATLPIARDTESSGDCENTGHRWTRWNPYTVSNTDFRDGLYHTTKTPWQARTCIDCGFSEQKKI